VGKLLGHLSMGRLYLFYQSETLPGFMAQYSPHFKPAASQRTKGVYLTSTLFPRGALQSDTNAIPLSVEFYAQLVNQFRGIFLRVFFLNECQVGLLKLYPVAVIKPYITVPCPGRSATSAAFLAIILKGLAG
jgi:hypothetical protein